MHDLGKMIKQQRLAAALTLRELAAMAEVSASHLGRIECGNRFPSARILRRIAKPLGLEEDELLILAGFLSSTLSRESKEESGDSVSRLDPYVARVLAGESFMMQRSVIGILGILKSLTRNIKGDSNIRHLNIEQ